MSLELIIDALGKAMQGRLGEIDKNALRDPEVKDVLTAYFAEREVRQKLVSKIFAPTLMIEYLGLTLEERIELDFFGKRHPQFFDNNDSGKSTKYLGGGAVRLLARKLRCINAMVMEFDRYLMHRKDGEIFKASAKTYNTIFKRLGGGVSVNLLYNIVSEIRPELNDYRTKSGVWMKDGPKRVLELFDFYLEHRPELQPFNMHYIEASEHILKEYGTLGRKLSDSFRNSIGKQGFKKIMEISTQQRPDILNYSSFKQVFILDAPKQLIRIFDFYLQTREAESFNVGYLCNSIKLQSKFGNLGSQLYDYIKRNKDLGGMKELITLAARERPDIIQFWHPNNEFSTCLAVTELVAFFDFYLQNKSDSTDFNTKYLRRNAKFRSYFGSRGENLVSRAYHHFRNNGKLNYLVTLAAEHRPEILEHWNYDSSKSRRKSNES